MDLGCGTGQGGLARIKANLASRVKKGQMTEDKAAQLMRSVQGTLDYKDFGDVDMVRPFPSAPAWFPCCAAIPALANAT